MSYPGTNQSRLAYLEPAHARHERSAFMYGVEYCHHFLPESAEIKELTSQPWSMRVSIFHMGAEATAAQRPVPARCSGPLPRAPDGVASRVPALFGADPHQHGGHWQKPPALPELQSGTGS